MMSVNAKKKPVSSKMQRSKSIVAAAVPAVEDEEPATQPVQYEEDDVETSTTSAAAAAGSTAGAAAGAASADNDDDASELESAVREQEAIEKRKREETTESTAAMAAEAESASVTAAAAAEPKKKKTKTASRPFSPIERDLRSIFSTEKGYSLWSDEMDLRLIEVTKSKASAEKLALYKANAGARQLSNMREEYVNVNVLMPCVPQDEEVLRKFIPDEVAAARKGWRGSYRMWQMSAVCKMQYVYLKGFGNYGKPKFSPESEQKAAHEFSFSNRLIHPDRINSKGQDVAAASWHDDLVRLWDHFASEIEKNHEIAPALHAECSEKVAQSKSSSADETIGEQYRRVYLKEFIQPIGDEVVTFKTRMFRPLNKEEQEDAKAGRDRYKAPSAELQQLYDEGKVTQKVKFVDFKVVRPKTPQEAKDTFADDPNPFVEVPYLQRDQIKEDDLGCVLYEPAITEEYKSKSYFKLKPLLLIWIRDSSSKPTEKKAEPAKPFIFSTENDTA